MIVELTVREDDGRINNSERQDTIVDDPPLCERVRVIRYTLLLNPFAALYTLCRIKLFPGFFELVTPDLSCTSGFIIERTHRGALPAELSIKHLQRKERVASCKNKFYEHWDTMPTGDIVGLINPETSFDKFIRINVQLLAGLRLFSTDFHLSGTLVNTNTRTLLPIVFEVSQMIFLTACQFRSVLAFWKTNPDFAVTVFTGMLPGALCTFKGFRLWFCQVELRELLIDLAILWEKSRFQVNIQRKTLRIAKRARLIRIWYLSMVIFVAGSYAMRPYLLLIFYQMSDKKNQTFDYSVTVYPTTYPFVINTMANYLACVIWEQFVAVLFGLYWASCDTMFAQLVTHTAIQFQVLRYELKSIGNESEVSSVNDEDIFLRKLCSIAKRHKQLFEHCNTIKAIYNPIIFLTMVTTAVNMCFCVLSLQRELVHGNYEEVAKNAAHVITLFVQSMIYCGYADNLTHENYCSNNTQSCRVAEAAYQCRWIERGSNFKINLQIIMMRAQKQYYITGYGFFRISFKQITGIVNTAMSYFTILKTMT